MFSWQQVAQPTPVFAGCSGGNPQGWYARDVCPGDCDPSIELDCECTESCNYGGQKIGLVSEFCSDYGTSGSCNSVNFSGMECGNGGRCTWTAPLPTPTPNPPANRYNCGTGYSCYNAGSGGYYSSLSSCQNNCKPPPPPPISGTPYPTPVVTDPTPTTNTCTGCGCPGEPACGGGCMDEHECGDITQFDCCQGACVPEGTNCSGGGQTCSYTMQASAVWLRVVSREGPTGTTAWKGSQTTSPVYGPDSAIWSGDGLDAQGYFQTYKPYENQPAKTFDKTKNKIDSQMRIDVTNYPTGSYTYTDECGDDHTTTVPSTPAHGGMWSNHFCSGGWAWEGDANNYPAKTRRVDGSYLYSSSTPDVDGCVSKFKSPFEKHDDLVQILQAADPNHWADLQYEGYWSYAFEGWEFFEHSKNVDTVVTLTPPANYHCQDVRWWGKPSNDKPFQEYNLGLTSNMDGSCNIRFNTKKYGNMLILEVAKDPAYERCVIQLEDYVDAPGALTSDITIDRFDGFNAHVTGESTEPTPPNKEQTNLWLAKTDFSQLSSIDIPASFTEVRDVNNNRYYYKHSNPTGLNQQCYANGEYPCNMSVDIYSYYAMLNQPTLPVGEYNLFCDVPGGTSYCSGNPACTMNGGTLSQCYGYNDCEDDSSNPNDHATVTVMCTPQCTNQCSPDPYDDGCGGTCRAGDQWGNPGAVTISDPFDGGVSNITTLAAPYTYQVTWGVAETVKTDTFDVVAYPQDAGYADIDAAIAAYTAGATNVVTYKSVPAVQGQSGYTTTMNILTGQKWNMRLAIRANNNSCYVRGESVSYVDFDLISSVGGDIQAVTNNTCSGGTRITTGPYPDVQNGTTVTTSDDLDAIANFSLQTGYKGFGVYGSIVNGQWGVNFLPFDPPMWHTPPVLTSRLRISNPDLSQAYVCAECNRESVFTCRVGSTGHTNAPAYNQNFYVQLYNLSNISWWQSLGGNAYGKNGLYSAVPASCTSGVGCNPIIIGDLSGADTLNSAGVPISNATISNTGGYYSDNDLTSDPNDGNPRGHNTTSNFTPVLENYTYFISDTSAPIPASATNIGANVVINTPITNRDQFKTAFGTNFVEENNEVTAWVPNSLTIDLAASTANWNVPAGEKWTVFVPGDLTLTGPTDHALNAQRYLIKVETGGFLSFIAGGDITFNENIGYGYDDDTDLSGYTTPIVEGVFIASDVLTVKSKGGSTPGDYKFVGAGTYIGWNGINLERKFDNGITRRSLNNNSPSELFIYRPDFMSNTPEFMKKASIDWREVN